MVSQAFAVTFLSMLSGECEFYSELKYAYTQHRILNELLQKIIDMS